MPQEDRPFSFVVYSSKIRDFGWSLKIISAIFLLLSAFGFLDFSLSLLLANVVHVNRLCLVLFLLVQQLSLFSTIEAWIGEEFLSIDYNSWIAPSICYLGLSLFFLRNKLQFISLILCGILLGGLSLISCASVLKMLISSVFLSVLFSLSTCLANKECDNNSEEKIKKSKTLIIVSLLLALSVSVFHVNPKKSNSSYWLINGKNQFTESLGEILTLYDQSIFTVKLEDLEKIPSDSTLIISDLGLTTVYDQESINIIKFISEQKNLNVILFAEHTNANDVADKINFLIGKDVVNNDLLVPYDNLDANGLTRAASIRTWSREALINRGASLRISSLSDLVLLRADAWWAEPNLADWLWVGDYIEQRQDNGSRKILAATYQGNARWTVVADSSMAINNMVIQDIQPILDCIALSEGWPIVQKDLLILLVIAFVTTNWIWFPIILIPVFSFLMSDQIEGSWQLTNETAFSESSFNSALSREPKLLYYSNNFYRFDKPVFNHKLQPNSVYFIHVNEGAILDEVKLVNCRRMGNLKLNEGLTLMNAQACSIKVIDKSLVKPMIGNIDECAAFIYNGRSNEKSLIILDPFFISQNAPFYNSKWLLKNVQESFNE